MTPNWLFLVLDPTLSLSLSWQPCLSAYRAFCVLYFWLVVSFLKLCHNCRTRSVVWMRTSARPKKPVLDSCCKLTPLCRRVWKPFAPLLSTTSSSSCEISGGGWGHPECVSLSAGQLWCVCKCQSISFLAGKVEMVASTYRKGSWVSVTLKIRARSWTCS